MRQWEDDDAKKRIEKPKPCKESERYYLQTAVTCKVSYTWLSLQKRYARIGSITFEDWKRTDKAFKRDHSPEAARFERFYKDLKAGKKPACAACNGTGKCGQCNGKGKVWRKEFIKCTYPACGGRGRYKVHMGGIQTCRRCNGTGKIALSEKWFECERCGGTGTCRECSGSGTTE